MLKQRSGCLLSLAVKDPPYILYLGAAGTEGWQDQCMSLHMLHRKCACLHVFLILSTWLHAMLLLQGVREDVGLFLLPMNTFILSSFCNNTTPTIKIKVKAVLRTHIQTQPDCKHFL